MTAEREHSTMVKTCEKEQRDSKVDESGYGHKFKVFGQRRGEGGRKRLRKYRCVDSTGTSPLKTHHKQHKIAHAHTCTHTHKERTQPSIARAEKFATTIRRRGMKKINTTGQTRNICIYRRRSISVTKRTSVTNRHPRDNTTIKNDNHDSAQLVDNPQATQCNAIANREECTHM